MLFTIQLPPSDVRLIDPWICIFASYLTITVGQLNPC